MDNIYFYAFHPERYDPRKTKPKFLAEIREALENLPLYPPKDNAAFTPLIEQLHQWAKDESRDGLYDVEAVEYYQDFPNNYLTEERAYFELAYTPQIKTEAWYLQMIETANQAGLIVYSDIDEGLYFPDGTSLPEWYRTDLETIVENQKPTISQDYKEVLDIIEVEKSNPTPIGKSNPYLANDEDKANIFQAIIKHKLAEYGYEPIEVKIYQDGSVVTKIEWKDTILELTFIGKYYQNTLSLSHYFNILPKNTILEKAFDPYIIAWIPDIAGIPPDIRKRDRDRAKNSDLNFSFILSEMRKIQICEQENFVCNSAIDFSVIRNFWKKHTLIDNLTSISELKGSIDRQIDGIFQWLGNSQDFYSYFDTIYQDTTHPLHSYYWSSTYYIPEYLIGNVLVLARYLQHPELGLMIEKQIARAKTNNDLNAIPSKILEKLMVGYDPTFYQNKE